MDLRNAIQELRSELTRVDRAIRALEQISGAGQSEARGLVVAPRRNPRVKRKVGSNSEHPLTMSSSAHST